MEAVDNSPLITVRMSDKAAGELAKACKEARNLILDEIQVDGRKPRKSEAHALEWLDWGSSWLVFPDARGVPSVTR